MKDCLKALLNTAAHKFGGTLVSTRGYKELRRTRALAIAQLTALEQKSLKKGLTGIIFSKDRALQIYTLLHSYFQLVENPAPLTIIFNASSEAHLKAYKQVETAFKKAPAKVTFVQETKKFRDVLLDVLAHINTQNLFFLVDDMVIIRPINLQLAAQVNPLETILSLRLSPHLNFCYTAQCAALPPKLTLTKLGTKAQPVYQFEWFKSTSEWAYPYSVDGHIFSTAEIRVLTRLAAFKAPNTYEGALMEFQDLCEHRTGLCYAETKVLNIPLNRVQSENSNISANISPEVLLGYWNEGKMLNYSHLRTHTPRAPHEEHPVQLTPRP